MSGYLTEGVPPSGKGAESLFICNKSVLSVTPLTHATNSKHMEKKMLSVQWLKNNKDLQNFIKEKKSTVPCYPVLLTVTGLPYSSKTKSIVKALNLKRVSGPMHFAHYELVASGFKNGKKIESAHVQRDHSLKFAMQAGLMCNCKVAAPDKKFEDNSTFNDPVLKHHLSQLAIHLQERPSLNDINRKMKRQSSQPPDSQTKRTDTRYLEESLIHGVGMTNLWKFDIDNSIRPFLETLGSCFTRNRMWLFIDLERDVPNLTLPIDLPNLQWYSRMQYLLRMSQMWRHAKSNSGLKMPITIFAVHHEISIHEIEKNINTLQQEIETVAGQMGVKNFFDLEIKRINLEENEKEGIRSTFENILNHLEKEEIPLSWVFLRSSLTEHANFYITHDELQQKAAECNINSPDLAKFCEFFTSYGSIFDIRQINETSNYVIVKPSDFLNHLEPLFQGEKTEDGILTSHDHNTAVVMQILSSVCLALPHPYLTHLSTNSKPNSYYIPSVQTTNTKTSCTPGAVQLVLSTESPRINLQLEVTKQLLDNMQNASLSFAPTEYFNSITVITEGDVSTGIILTFQGDVTEIMFQNIDVISDSQLEELCSSIVESLQEMFTKKTKHLIGIRYHFAILCKKDLLPKSLAYNVYRKRHVLPITILCEDCKTDIINKRIIKAWNSALEKSPIPGKIHLNGDLSVEDITVLLLEIAEYPWEAIYLLAESLNVKIDEQEPTKKKTWLVLGMLEEWEEKRRENDEPAQKVLHRTLLEIDIQWEKESVRPKFKDLKKPNFIKLARKMDIQTSGQVKAMIEQPGNSKGILENKKIVSKTTKHFQSDKSSLDWEAYGCKLFIQEGSINKGDKGTVEIYVLYSEDFQLHKGMRLVSAIYYVSLSHELLRPATLEIEHCSDVIYHESGRCNLSFVKISNITSGPPYCFETTEGGNFDNDHLCTIQSSQFLGYAVAFLNWARSPVGWNLESIEHKKIKLTSQCSLGILHFLTISDQNELKVFNLRIILTKYLKVDKEFFRGQIQSAIINEKFQKVTLKKGNVVTIAVSEKNEESEVINWNGYPLTIASKWEISSESTENGLQLCPSEIEEDLAPSIDIGIEWKDRESPPERDQFRIHVRGIEGNYHFPVTIPPPRSSISTCSQSITTNLNVSGETEKIENPPTLRVFQNQIASKVSCTSSMIAIQLLKEDNYTAFRHASEQQTWQKQYEILFNHWKRQGGNFTWEELVKALKSPSILECTIAETIIINKT